MYTIVFNGVKIFKENFFVETRCIKLPSFNIEMCTVYSLILFVHFMVEKC